jgi:hypothetical protein
MAIARRGGKGVARSFTGGPENPPEGDKSDKSAKSVALEKPQISAALRGLGRQNRAFEKKEDFPPSAQECCAKANPTGSGEREGMTVP